MLNTNEYIERCAEIRDMSSDELLDECLQEDSDAIHLIVDHFSVLREQNELAKNNKEKANNCEVAFNDLADAYQNLLLQNAMAERQEYLDAVEQRDKVYEHPAKSASDLIDAGNREVINTTLGS